MKTFKILAAPIALAAAALSVAGTAQAQPYGGDRDARHHARHDARHDGWGLTPARTAQIRQDINSLGNAIDRAAARRTISWREAQGLRRQARDVQRTYAQYQRGGLTRAEVRNLQDRVNSVRVALRMERHDWDGRRG